MSARIAIKDSTRHKLAQRCTDSTMSFDDVIQELLENAEKESQPVRTVETSPLQEISDSLDRLWRLHHAQREKREMHNDLFLRLKNALAEVKS